MSSIHPSQAATIWSFNPSFPPLHTCRDIHQTQSTHAGNVALILNPHTGCTSPQYHVVFDDDFTTVNDIKNSLTPSTWQQLVSKYKGASEINYDLAKLWFDCSDLRDLCVPPNRVDTDDQQGEQPLAALQVTEHNNIEQISSLMVPTEPPPVEDPGHAQAAALQVNFTSDTNILQGILRNPYPKTSYPSSSKTKWQKPEKVTKKPDYIDTFFLEIGYTPKKASSRLPHPSTLSTSVSLHQAMLDRTLTELPNPMIHAGTCKHG
jgi:hypothetical protein